MATILIVEDEQKLSDVLRDYLQASAFSVQQIADGALVLAHVQSMPPDLILLDLMLPHVDGVTLCREIRRFSNVPILMVTAKVDEIDRLLGLEIGADDYICKPFSPREVVARVKAVLRRIEPTPSPAVFNLNEDRLELTCQGHVIEVSAVEFQLLKVMARNPGRIYSRQQLMDNIYSDNRFVSDRTIDSHIKKLRKKMADGGVEMELIQSVYGAGYRVVI